MAFNPDAFIAKNKSFNPDAFIAKNKPQPKVETIPTKQEAVTLPPPQRSVMSAIINPKVQVQEPETELTDFKAIEDKITTNGYEDLTPDEQIIYLENMPQLPNVQPYYPDELNNSAKSTAQPTLKETHGVSKPMPNLMLPMGGGAFAVKPKQEQVMTDEQPQIGAYDPTLKQKIADWFRGDGLPENADRIEKIHYGIGKVMRPLVKFAVGKTLKVPDVGWAIVKKVAGDTIPEEVQSMNLEQAMDWAAGYNPSGFEKAVGSLAEFTGGISTAKQMLPTSQAKTVLDKAGQAALEFGTASAGKELSKGIAGAIDPKADYEYGGSAAITEEALLGAAFSLAGSGLKGLWGKLKPTEQSQALKILGLKNGASEDEIRKAAQQLALKYHPDKVRGMEDKFKSVMQARDEALKKTTNKDIIYPKQKPKMLTGEQNIGVSTDVAQNPVKPIPPDKVFGQGLGIGENLPAQSTPAVQTPEVKANHVGTGNDATQGNVEGSGANVQETQNIVPNPVDMAKKSENGDISSKPATISPVQENEGIPKELEPLAKEARKYKTADEWVKYETEESFGRKFPKKEVSKVLTGGANLMPSGRDYRYADAKDLLRKWGGNKSDSDIIRDFYNVVNNTPAPEDGGQKPITQEVKEKTETQNEEPKGGGSVIGDPIVGSTNAIDSGRIKVDMEPKGKPQTAREIVDFVGRAFNILIRGKATHTRLAKRALGWFDTKHTGIRLVDVRSLTTAMHEIGHHIDYTLSGRISKTPPTSAIGVELTKLGKALYGNKKAAGGYKSEGFAEYIRKYLTDDSPESTPALHKWFTETYLEEHTDISSKLAKTKTMIDKWRMQGAEARVDSQISTKKIKGSWSERIEKGMLWLDTTQRDELAPIRTAMKNAGIGKDELSPSDDPYQIAVARADTAGAIAEHFVIEYTTDLAGNRTGKGLREVLAPVSKDIKNFTRWIVAARARLLLKKGVNPGISQADADYIYEKYDNQQWQDTLQEITDWNHRLIDYLVEAGGMSTESAQLIKDTNPIYIPFMRAFKEGEIRGGGVGKSIAKAGKAVKKIKGSGREIIDPIESMIKQCEKIISTAHKAEVAHALARLADKKGTASMIWKVPAPQQATRFEAEQLKKDIAKIAYDRMGLDPELVSSSMLEHWDEVLTVYSNASQYYGKDNIVALVVDGKQQFYEVDPALYEAIEGLDQYTLPWVLNVVLGKPNRMVRLGATGLNASFGLIRNFIRDAATFTVLSKHAKAGPLSAIKGIVEDIIDTPNAQRFKAVGGKMASQVLADRKAAQHLKKRVLKNTISGEVFYTVAHPIDALRELFGVTEAGTRIGEFGPALKYGEKKWGKNSKAAMLYALNQSKDVTTNFSRHGKMAKVLNQIIPFYNAAIQGPDKMVRTFRERPFTTTVKAIAALTIPAIWAWWDSKDEDWYKNLPVYERVNYLHFKIPGTDKIIRIPVPFELGHIFMSAPVAALDAQYRKDPKIVTEMFEESLKQANPFDWPAAVSPIIDVLKNEDFAGRPIVSKASEYKLPEDQYGNYTTQLMKIIGQQLKVPPAQLEHIVNGYSGGLYQRVSKSIDLTTQEEITAGDLPVLGTLFLKEPYAPKAQLERFYDRRDLLNQKYASDKISSTEIEERVILNKQSKKLSAQWKKLPEAKTATERKNIHLEMTRILTGE